MCVCMRVHVCALSNQFLTPSDCLDKSLQPEIFNFAKANTSSSDIESFLLCLHPTIYLHQLSDHLGPSKMALLLYFCLYFIISSGYIYQLNMYILKMAVLKQQIQIALS